MTTSAGTATTGTAGTGGGATDEVSLYFVGTATTVIRCAGFTVLTDPNFLHRGQRAYLGFGLSSPRLTEPALRVDQLPELDAVVLSHLHGDHWDRVARRGLDRDLPIVTTPHASKRLQLQGFARATGLRTWGEQVLVRGDRQLRVTAVPGRHAPGPLRKVLPPVMGTVLEFGPVAGAPHTRVYLSGDTLLYDAIAEIPRRFPELDAGVVNLGGTTLPGGLVVTLDGETGADLVKLVDPAVVVPVHIDDYPVFKSPLSAFTAAMAARGLADKVRTVARGETVSLRP